jgi:hypothetical protein
MSALAHDQALDFARIERAAKAQFRSASAVAL